MFQLRMTGSAAFDPMLVRDPLLLRSPQVHDHEQWAGLRADSRQHLIKWENDWTDKDVAMSAFRRRLRVWERQRRLATGLSLFAFRMDGDALIGGVTLSHIRYGASQSGTLGYWVGEGFLRRGYGQIMVDETVRHAFESIGLNRIEAACQPENEASARLLAGLGFVREGRARDYLRINGVWRDHDVYALTAADRAGATGE